jgi:hypothetical protein
MIFPRAFFVRQEKIGKKITVADLDVRPTIISRLRGALLRTLDDILETPVVAAAIRVRERAASRARQRVEGLGKLRRLTRAVEYP